MTLAGGITVSELRIVRITRIAFCLNRGFTRITRIDADFLCHSLFYFVYRLLFVCAFL